MSTASYNCPCCGGPIKFSGESGRLECAACGNSYEPEALEMLNASESGEQISFERPKEGFRAEEGVQAYLCKNCGAELMTEDTTTAAECPSLLGPSGAIRNGGVTAFVVRLGTFPIAYEVRGGGSCSPALPEGEGLGHACHAAYAEV